MSKTSLYIDGIHNWCDRWGERCRYTDCCYSFQMDKEAGFDRLNKNYTDEELWAHVGQRHGRFLIFMVLLSGNIKQRFVFLNTL